MNAPNTFHNNLPNRQSYILPHDVSLARAKWFFFCQGCHRTKLKLEHEEMLSCNICLHCYRLFWWLGWISRQCNVIYTKKSFHQDTNILCVDQASLTKQLKCLLSVYGDCWTRWSIQQPKSQKQWLPYTVATTSFQCDDTYAALISLHEGGGGKRNAHAVFRADRVYICIWTIHSRCYTSTKHMLIGVKFGMMITLQKNTKKGESSVVMNIQKQFMTFFSADVEVPKCCILTILWLVICWRRTSKETDKMINYWPIEKMFYFPH